jgi:hypothetical protein
VNRCSTSGYTFIAQLPRAAGHAGLDLRISSRYRQAGRTQSGRGESISAARLEARRLVFPDWNPIPPAGLWKNQMEILRENAIAGERSNRFGTRLALALAVAMVFQVSAQAQADEYHVKAAFLFNFAKFVEWPTETFKSAADPIVICVLGQNPFGNAIEETISGKSVGGRALSVREISGTQHPWSCQILFVNSSALNQFRAVIGRIKGAGVLSVGEAEGFTADGGVINLRVERGSVRLEINVAAAEYTNIHISAKLLSLAEVVRKVP